MHYVSLVSENVICQGRYRFSKSDVCFNTVSNCINSLDD